MATIPLDAVLLRMRRAIHSAPQTQIVEILAEPSHRLDLGGVPSRLRKRETRVQKAFRETAARRTEDANRSVPVITAAAADGSGSRLKLADRARASPAEAAVHTENPGSAGIKGSVDIKVSADIKDRLIPIAARTVATPTAVRPARR